MKYKVKVSSRYNDQNGQASDYEAGDVLETVPGYGASLVASGLVEEILPDEFAPSADETVDEGVMEDDTEAPVAEDNRKKKSSPRAARPRNVFAPQ